MMTATETAAASKRALLIGSHTSSVVLIILLSSLLSLRPAHGLEVPKGFVAFRGVGCDSYKESAQWGTAGPWKFELDVESAKECLDMCKERKACATVTYDVKRQWCSLYKKCKPAEDEQYDDSKHSPYYDCPKSCRYFNRVGDDEKDHSKYITAARIGRPFKGKIQKKYWGTPYYTDEKGFVCAGGEEIKSFSGESDTGKGTTLLKCMKQCNKKDSCKAISFRTGNNPEGDSKSWRYCTLWTDCTYFTKFKNTRSWVKGNSVN